MITAQTIINKSLRLLGVIVSGEAPTAAEATDALDSLNSIIDAYAANPAYYFTDLDSAFPLTVGKSNYCIGNESVPIQSLTSVGTTATVTTLYPHSLQTKNKVTISGASPVAYNVTAEVTVVSPYVFTYTVASTTSPATGVPVFTCGDFYTSRPIRMLAAFVRDADNVDHPLGLVTEQYWTNIFNKADVADVSTKLLYRPNFPFGQVILYPVPGVADTLHLKSEKTISYFPALNTKQLLPPGYRRLLELSLAIDLASEYGTKVAPETVANIKGDLAGLIKTNMQDLQASKVQNHAGGGTVVPS